MADKSQEEHLADVEFELGHHEASGTDGGKCLNRHIGTRKTDCSCSHMWQGYKRMKDDDSALYDWPKYESLSVGHRKTAIKGLYSSTFGHCDIGKNAPKNLGIPEEGDWDVKDDNFAKVCYLPYWHEAHHIVPNSTLRNVIEATARGTADEGASKRVFRKGMLDEEYNLNHKQNMIVLPMNKIIAKAIGLPRHRLTPEHRSHNKYSNHVKTELERIFSKLKQDVVLHKKAKYSPVVSQIKKLSDKLHGSITGSSAAALDEMKKSEFQ
ncbi:MAG: AHH domain-containing protein [Planctomycetes bacterium]|nr:AHH domain-containing protein [Planctomycetota bacterium]MCB9890883.1 AHH domain-containing protein [Planctomycetota bacterium]